MNLRTTSSTRRGRQMPPPPPSCVIQLDTLVAPERYDHPEIGAQERVDPEAAARRILSAHRTVGGNSTHAARLMGMTYQGLRRAIRRFEEPRMCSDGTTKMILVDFGDSAPPRSLDVAVEHLRTPPNRAVLEQLEQEAKTLLDLAVSETIRLVDIARAADLDPTRLTKFRNQSGTLPEHELHGVISAVEQLRDKPIRPRSGRRAAA